MDKSIEIPDELIEVQKDATIAMDGLTINSLEFLSIISLHIYFRTMYYIPNSTAVYYQIALNNIISVYKSSGSDLTKNSRDSEFQAELDPIVVTYDPSITVNYTNPQEHFTQSDRNNQYIKKHFGAVYHRLPFDRLPHEMVKYLGLELARKLNIFPAKHGV